MQINCDLSYPPAKPKSIRKHKVDTKNISKSYTEFSNCESEIVIVPKYILIKFTFF